MDTYHLFLPTAVYLLGDGYEQKVSQNTEYVIFAPDRAVACELAHRFIGTQISTNSPRSALARVEPIDGAIEAWSVTPKYEGLLELLNRATNFVGTINIQGAVVCSPYNDGDVITMLVDEGDRQRVISNDLFILEDERRLEWGDPATELSVAALSKAVQQMF